MIRDWPRRNCRKKEKGAKERLPLFVLFGKSSGGLKQIRVIGVIRGRPDAIAGKRKRGERFFPLFVPFGKSSGELKQIRVIRVIRGWASDLWLGRVALMFSSASVSFFRRPDFPGAFADRLQIAQEQCAESCDRQC